MSENLGFLLRHEPMDFMVKQQGVLFHYISRVVWKYLQKFILPKNWERLQPISWLVPTPPEINIEPQNDGLEDDFP